MCVSEPSTPGAGMLALGIRVRKAPTSTGP